MEEQIKTIEHKMEAQAQRQEAQSKKFEEDMAKMMQAISELKENRRDSNHSPFRGNSKSPRHDPVGANSTRLLGYVPKLAFPIFDGSNARLWIKKCSKYFSLYKFYDEQKVDLASLHMVDKAECWVTSYLAVRKSVDWADFVIDLNARFKDSSRDNVVENFNKLQ